MTDQEKSPLHGDRRKFIKQSLAISALVTTPDLFPFSSHVEGYRQDLPWYKRVSRWGQVNITEKDPEQYDVQWWRKYWKKTNTQGVIINAGGIVAYYPSKIALHRQATFLKGRDLFGELCKVAHEQGLAVFARMDSNRAHQEFYNAHPDWFAVDKDGKPYKAGELFISCIFGPYYSQHIPAILREIATTYKPQGFTDNSWSGLGRDSICYCKNCTTNFKKKTGNNLPEKKNWDDQVYREWISWNYERRVEIWELNNKVTKEAGGKDCVWSGMNSGSIEGQARSFRDYRELCKRADIVMLDHQARGNNQLLQENTHLGLLVGQILGPDKLKPESMAMYQAGTPTFRVASKSVVEARMWMINGIAGGIQPWWHHIAAYHEDRRMYDTAAPIMLWHKNNEQYLLNRKPVASVAIVWSQTNTDFFGRDHGDEKVEMPLRGIVHALVKARIPYTPVHIDDIHKVEPHVKTLILPNIGSMNPLQAEAITRFVKNGGSIFATGQTSLYNEWGERKEDYALADVFGVHRIHGKEPIDESTMPKLAWNSSFHTYFRLLPELRATADGPLNGKEPEAKGRRHDVLLGFEKTDLLPFGGFVEELRAEDKVVVPFTFVPQFPVYPPETAWMRESSTNIGGLYLKETNNSRIAFMPAGIDKLYAQFAVPDHGLLLQNIIRWVTASNQIIEVKGPGLISCVVYEQKNKLIVHLVNQTSEAAWKPPMEELITIGPVTVKLKLPGNVNGNIVQGRVNTRRLNSRVTNGWAEFTVPEIYDHEMIVVG